MSKWFKSYKPSKVDSEKFWRDRLWFKELFPHPLPRCQLRIAWSVPTVKTIKFIHRKPAHKIAVAIVKQSFHSCCHQAIWGKVVLQFTLQCKFRYKQLLYTFWHSNDHNKTDALLNECTIYKNSLDKTAFQSTFSVPCTVCAHDSK